MVMATSDTRRPVVAPGGRSKRCVMAPKGPRVPATGRPAVNLKIAAAVSSLPTPAWKAQKKGEERNASTLA